MCHYILIMNWQFSVKFSFLIDQKMALSVPNITTCLTFPVFAAQSKVKPKPNNAFCVALHSNSPANESPIINTIPVK